MTEDGQVIDVNEEVRRIAADIFQQDDVPFGAVVQIFTPIQSTHAGWTMLLIRNPVNVAEKQ